MTSESKDWSNVRLSLEKPYKDPNGVPLKKVLDISNEEEFIYEQPKAIDEQLGTRLQRVFDERGNAIWDEYTPSWGEELPDAREASDENEEDDEDEESEEDDSYNVKKKPMTVEELTKLRMETVPTLMQALNELMISRDVLGVYLKTALPSAPPEGITPELSNVLPPNSLVSTVVSKLPPIQSMQAFNLQLSVGGKDEALRKSASAFKSASQSMRRALASGERYWTDALRARNANWVLVPAPLPFGAMTRRSTDSNAMDLCISYGLEHATLNNRLNCLVWLNTEDGKGPIAQGSRKPTRLCVSVISTEPDGRKRTSRSAFMPRFVSKVEEKAEDVLEDLQREAVEEEILRELMSNAGTLSSAPVWVREETVLVNISASLTLKFERVQEAELEPSPLPDSDPATNAICDVVYHALRLVLLRLHAYTTEIRNFLGSRSGRPIKPLLLHAVVELFQYYLFVTKLERHLKVVEKGLESAGIHVLLRINRLGDTVEELISLLATNYNLDEAKKRPIGGEVIFRVAQRQTLRFTLQVPSILVADLSQSILQIHSMLQLDELLQHEANRCVLQHFFDIGRANTTGQARESWFVDVVAATCFGSSDGTAIRFKLINRVNWKVDCAVEIAERGKAAVHKKYEPGDSSLFEWAEGIIKDAIGS